MAITQITAAIADDTKILGDGGDNTYSGELAAPKVSGIYDTEVLAYDDAGNVALANSSTDSELLIDVTLWKPPKTDWKYTDRFNFVDYNRIKNNLIYLHNRAVELWRDFSIEDMGADIEVYTAGWDVDIFNLFERNLETINQNIFKKDYGYSQTFFENGPFIKYNELNRIESAMLSMKDILDRHKLSVRKVPFTLGRYKEVRI